MSETNSVTTVPIPEIETYWNERIREFEVDPIWKQHPIYQSERYKEYKRNWKKAAKGEYLSDFPLNIEVEPTYYCNLKCPFCPRFVAHGERQDKHMKKEIWGHIIEECSKNNLPSMQMDHEAESLMNPKFFEYLEDTKKAGILETWLHSNGNMVNEKNARKLIQGGLKRINFSIDAFKKETYDKLRVGGKYEKVINNVLNFLKIKEELNASYLRVRVSFLEQKENFLEKKEFFNFWSKQKGINTITFQKYLDCEPFEKEDEDINLSEKELEKKYKDEKPFFCGAPWETPIIQEDGKIAPCGMPIREHNKDFFLGDINKGDTISGCWNGDKMNKLRAKHKNNEWYKVNMCRVCVKIGRTAQKRDLNSDDI